MAFQPGQFTTSSAPPPKKTAPPGKKGQETEQIAKEKELLEEERIYRKGVVSIKDIVAPAGLKIEPTYIVLNETFVRTVFVVSYPR